MDAQHPPNGSQSEDLDEGKPELAGILAGWVARTRPFAEPLSPRGPQPVVAEHRGPAKEVPMGRWLQKYRYGSLGTKAFRRECRSCNWLSCNNLQVPWTAFWRYWLCLAGSVPLSAVFPLSRRSVISLVWPFFNGMFFSQSEYAPFELARKS
jgi:hypothetical protein